MPALPNQLAGRAATEVSPSNSVDQIYLSGVLLAISSFIFLLLILPPMIWHFRNRNIGATALVAWTAILLLFNFINEVLWPRDNIDNWYNGVGLCDFEVKIQIASETARPASLACILRALAAVLNTDRATLIKTKAQRRRGYAIDLMCCLGFPLLQMLFHYIVQTRRYDLYGISGCIPMVGNNLATVFLIDGPELIWTFIDAFYAVLILVRLYRYRLTFSSIIANSNTTKSRFLRLYIICIVWILGYLPVECYILYFNFGNDKLQPYSWAATHNAENWREIVMVPSDGKIVFNRWIWLSGGFIVFAFFGFGKDAVNMYRTGLLALGLGRVFPSLRQEYRGSIAGTISSYSSKAKMVLKRKSLLSSSTSKSISDASQTSSSTAPATPEKDNYDDATVGHLNSTEKQSSANNGIEIQGGEGKGHLKPQFLNRILPTSQRKKPSGAKQADQLVLADLSNQSSTVKSMVTSGPRSPTLAERTRSISSDEVLMRTEVRQGSVDEPSQISNSR